MMQSGLLIQAGMPQNLTGEWWHDFFLVMLVAVPNVTAMVLGILTWLSSRNNGRGIRNVERTLNGKANKSAEDREKVDIDQTS